jgi:hypothetical protein
MKDGYTQNLAHPSRFELGHEELLVPKAEVLYQLISIDIIDIYTFPRVGIAIYVYKIQNNLQGNEV